MQIKDRIVDFRRVKASQLQPNPRNWRIHSESQQQALQGILSDVGYVDALMVRELPDGQLELIDGHLRSETTPDMEVPVLVVDLDDEEVAKVLATFDPISALAETDKDKLAELMVSIETDSGEMQSMLEQLAKENDIDLFEPGAEELADPEPQLDRAAELQEKWKTERGQLWIIEGRQTHRLVCGDSTSSEDVERLMDGERAGMVWADPPYGYEYQSNMRTKSAKFDVLENDDKILSGFIPLLEKCSSGWVLVCTSWKVVVEWIEACKPLGSLSNLIVWDKGGGGIGDLTHTLSTDYELILAFNRGETIKGKRIGSVWSIGKDSSGSYEHATQKPVELPAQAMDVLSESSELIYDPFLGSGTTMVAAEQLNRRCYGLELEPKYCAVILERMTELGCEATLQTLQNA